MPRECLPRCAPLVPEGARIWVAALMHRREWGDPFEHAVLMIPHEYKQAIFAWRAAALGEGWASAPDEQ